MKIVHIPIDMSDRDGAPGAVCAPAAGNGPRHRLGIPAGSFGLVSECLRGGDATVRSKCTSQLSIYRMDWATSS